MKSLKGAICSLGSLALFLFASGCATLPPHAVPILPPPRTSFPAPKPATIRLPVEFIFPSGQAIAKNIGDYFTLHRDKVKDPHDPSANLNILHIWSGIQEPIYLEKNAWLVIRPKDLSVGSMRSDPKQITSTHAVVEMTADPEVIFGRKPKAAIVPIPPLKTFVPGPSVFYAISDVRITYRELNEYLLDPRLKLIGMVLPGTGGQKVTLDGIRVYGSGGKVVVEAKIHYQPLIINLGSKPAKLTLYLKGTPRYRPARRVFDMPDLDYDIKTSDLMVQVADWLFKSDFRNQLRKVVKIPVGPKMDMLKVRMDLVLNRPIGQFTRLSTQVNKFKVLDGFADNEGIEVRFQVQGNAVLQVTWN